MRFRGVGNESDTEKYIPIEIIYSKEQQRLLEENFIPENTYFDKVDKVIFSINEEFYKEVKEYGYCGDRFATGGKFEIKLI